MAVTTLPADELAQLKKDLAEKQDDTSKLAKDIDRLKAQIADLSKTVGEIDQKTSAYEKAAGAATDQLKELTDYVTREKKMLAAALPAATVTDVEGKKGAALDHLAELKKELDKAIADTADLDKAYRAAKDAAALAQAAYKVIADLPSTNADIIKDLTGLRTAADKQGVANSLGREYLLVLIMQDRLNAFKSVTPDDYKKQLNDAGSAVAKTSEAQTTAKDALDTSTAAQQKAQKDFDDARANWRQATLDSIPATTPVAAAAPVVTPASPVAPTAPAVAPPAPVTKV